MSLIKQKFHRRKRGRSPVVLFLLILIWSLVVGWGLAQAAEAPSITSSSTQVSSITTTDIVPPKYQLGQELYLKNCATCHIALPPGVLPTQTWQQLLQDPQHYGQELQPLLDPPRSLVWNYLLNYSRPENKEEETPYRVDTSRYFKALHPRVKLSRPVQISSCVSCHPSAAQYNFRRLTAEWQNSQ